MASCKSLIENCVSDIGNWKVNNKLKLDRHKTEFLLISSRYRPRPPLESLKVDNTCTTVVQTNSTRNLWPSSDAELFMSLTEYVEVSTWSTESVRKRVDLERLSLSFRLARPGISPVERICNGIDSDVELSCTEPNAYEHLSPFELSSAAMKIGVWINSAGLNNLDRP